MKFINMKILQFLSLLFALFLTLEFKFDKE